MLRKLKCLLGKHVWVEVFDVDFTFPSGTRVGIYNKYCAHCGTKRGS